MIFHGPYNQEKSSRQWRFMLVLLMDYTTFFIVPTGFQIAETHLVLIELRHTEVPLLLSHLCPNICWLIHSCCFVWTDNKTVKVAVKGYRALVLMCVLSKEQRVTRRTNSPKMFSIIWTHQYRSWQCRPSFHKHKHSGYTLPGSLLHLHMSHPPRHILQKVTWQTIKPRP